MYERFAVVDVETTGLSPTRDRVVEMACVQVDAGRITGQWSTLVNPGGPIPAFATAIHGITDEDVADAPSFAQAMFALRCRVGDRIVAAHNASFDLNFLRRLDPARTVCTMRLARLVVPEAPNHRNQTLRSHFGVDRFLDTAAQAHRALGDALVTAHVLLAMRARCSSERWDAALREALLRTSYSPLVVA